MKKIFIYLALGIGAVFALIGMAFVGVYIAMQFGLLTVRGSITARNQFFLSASPADSATTTPPCVSAGVQTCAWNNTPQWGVVSAGLAKDAPVIERVSKETGVSARMITAVVMPEQLRFFTSERELFKRIFEPLKILGSMSQFSLGVSGIKEDTAHAIEVYAQSPTSPFYPGTTTAALFAYAPGTDRNTELFNRLTDEHNHYYSYLYTALYIKELEAQWLAAGYDITNKPEVVVTLFNIGFGASHPNANPSAAGAPIQVGGTVYPFGELGALYFYSDELVSVFPRPTVGQ